MNIFLKKVRIKTLFSLAEPIIVEPLELEYLQTISNLIGFNSYIVDELFPDTLSLTRDIEPDVVVLTGYNVAERKIIEEAKFYKRNHPNTIIIVGGVHVQLNPSSFYHGDIDYVVHSQDLEIFKAILLKIQGEDVELEGVDYRVDDRWIKGGRKIVSQSQTILPNRDFFYSIREKTHYLEKRKVALIKGSLGCPFACSYCYCRLLNDGRYIKADYQKMVEEIASISADYFWIVDDTLFATRSHALSFIDEAEKIGLRKKFIAYLRADFILRERDLLPRLKSLGLDEIIIGFEAITDEELKAYNKNIEAIDYPKVIDLLKANNIDFTGLFMVQDNYGLKEFKNLYSFIRKNKIEVFTLSIFTPIKGTKEYDKEKKNLITENPRKFDFLHLVTRSRLPRFFFYLCFYGIHLRLLGSKRIGKYILRRKS